MKTKHLSLAIAMLTLAACGGDKDESSSSAISSSSMNSSSVSSSVSSVSSSVMSSQSSSQQSSSSVPSGSARPAKLEGFGEGTTGGAGGPIVVARTGTEINQALCGRSSMSDPIIIHVDGTINHGNTSGVGCNTADDKIEIKGTSNISIIGVGDNALFDELGIHLRDASNVIIQNVHIRNVKKSGSPTSNGGDAIGMESGVSNVWVDHNTLEASGGEKDGYDSLIDMKAGVTDVTVSYNFLRDSSRGGLVGSSDSDDKNTRITFHHNWYRNIQQRTPLLRHGLAHTYNNYWSNDDITYMYHGINSRMNARVLVESNYFYNTNNVLIASDDSDEPGCWETNNDNTVEPEIYYSRSVGNGALVVPEVVNGQFQSTCSVSVPYNYAMDAAQDVPNIVMYNAGHGVIDGGGNHAGGGSGGGQSSKPSSSSSVGSSSSSVGGGGGVPSGSNLSLLGGADGTSKASGTSYGNVADGDESTYWSPGSASNERVSVKFTSAMTVSSVIIREPTNTVTSWSLVNHANGNTIASGDYIGNELAVNFAPVSLQKLNLMIHSASAIPMISEFELYGGSSSTGGSGSGNGGGASSSSNSSVSNPDNSGQGASCVSTGSQNVSSTIIVGAGQTYDGQCKTFNPTFGGGSQQEGQPPVFRVEDGGTLKNVIIGLNGADGVHLYGDTTVDNVTWLDVGEDALTVKAAGNVTVRNITGSQASDKFFQLNAKTNFYLENCKVSGAGKLFRENGGKCYPVNVTVNGCALSNIKEAVFRSDCDQSEFKITNSTYNNVDEICHSGSDFKSCGEF